MLLFDIEYSFSRKEVSLEILMKDVESFVVGNFAFGNSDVIIITIFGFFGLHKMEVKNLGH